MLYVSIG